MIEMKVTGIKENMQRLRNIGETVQENARKNMHRAAARIEKTAKMMAPVDQGNLEAAIKTVKTYEGRGRLAIDVMVDTASGPERLAIYAIVMHEGEYELGPKSLEKQASVPVIVGNRYLTRAGDEERDRLNSLMIDIVEDSIK